MKYTSLHVWSLRGTPLCGRYIPLRSYCVLFALFAWASACGVSGVESPQEDRPPRTHTPTAQNGTATAPLPQGSSPKTTPQPPASNPSTTELVLQNIEHPNVLSIWNRGAEQGRNAHALTFFADSNTNDANGKSMHIFSDLAAAHAAFASDAGLVNAVRAFTAASFERARNGTTAAGGNRTANVLMTLAAELDGDIRPRIALILIGSGDHQCLEKNDDLCINKAEHPTIPTFGAQTPATFEARLNKIIDETVSRGVLPVLFTKADDLSPAGDAINDKIKSIGNSRGIPWADLAGVIRTQFPNGTWSYDNPALHYTDAAHVVRNRAITQVIRQLVTKLNITSAR